MVCERTCLDAFSNSGIMAAVKFSGLAADTCRACSREICLIVAFVAVLLIL